MMHVFATVSHVVQSPGHGSSTQKPRSQIRPFVQSDCCSHSKSFVLRLTQQLAISAIANATSADLTASLAA
jgi:hypothetical protein